jgi:hypothetical protein
MKKRGREPLGKMDAWYDGFMERHKDFLKVMVTRKRSPAQIAAASKETLDGFYELFDAYVAKYNLTPARILNLDETGTEALGGRAKAVVPKQAHSAPLISAPQRDHMSILATIRADGQCLPLLYIFRGHYNTRPRVYRMTGCPEGSWTTYSREPPR